MKQTVRMLNLSLNIEGKFFPFTMEVDNDVKDMETFFQERFEEKTAEVLIQLIQDRGTTEIRKYLEKSGVFGEVG